VETIDQSVYFVERRNKPALLAHLIKNTGISRALVFTRTKHGADRVVRQLYKSGIRAEAIHGNKTQNARQRALQNFKNGKTPILIASDIASRGIDVEDISHVFNYDLTHEPETYVHRIGRTARAGASGHAISFCDSEERPNLHAIERLIRRKIRVNEDLPTFAEHVHEEKPERDRASQRRSHSPQQQNRSQHSNQRDGGRRDGGRREGQRRDGNRSATPALDSARDRQAANSRSHSSGNSSSRSQSSSHPQARSQAHSTPHPRSGAQPQSRSNAHSNAHAQPRRSSSSGHPTSGRVKHPLDRRGQHGYRKHHAKHR
jgi:ATP-dependent RNA helicase RhlE